MVFNFALKLEIMENFIEESKQLFKSYNKLYSLDICTYCCVSKNFEEELWRSNRFEVSTKAIYEYNSSAKGGYTLETASELKYFAPRIIELVLQEEEIHHSTELFFTRFAHIPYTAWNKEELNFFQKFADAYCVAITEEKRPYGEDLTSLLLMLSKLPINISKLLAYWMSKKSISNLLLLADFYLDELSYLKVNNAFAEKEFNDVIIDFMFDEKIINQLLGYIEKLFWVDEIQFSEEQENQLNYLYTFLKTQINF